MSEKDRLESLVMSKHTFLEKPVEKVEDKEKGSWRIKERRGE